MASVTFASMAMDATAFLPGCPSATIEQTMRKIATDLCQRARVWRDDMTQIPMTAGVTSFTPASPYAYGEFVEAISAYITVNGTRSPVTPVSYEKARRMYPEWPMAADGTPQLIAVRIPGQVMLAPTPDTTGTLDIYGVLRPTATATSWDAQMYREFHRELFHGVLHELMAMPNRSWSDAKLADYHGKQWTYLLMMARDRADRDFTNAELTVQMRPFA